MVLSKTFSLPAAAVAVAAIFGPVAGLQALAQETLPWQSNSQAAQRSVPPMNVGANDSYIPRATTMAAVRAARHPIGPTTLIVPMMAGPPHAMIASAIQRQVQQIAITASPIRRRQISHRAKPMTTGRVGPINRLTRVARRALSKARSSVLVTASLARSAAALRVRSNLFSKAKGGRTAIF